MEVRISIDPGKSGGIVWSYKQPNTTDNIQGFSKCPDTIKGFLDLLSSIKVNAYNDYDRIYPDKEGIPTFSCIIEKVWGRKTDGGSRAFVFGQNYGTWLTSLTAMDIPYKEVAPKTWQIHCGKLSRDKPERKRQLKAIAQKHYPQAKITLYTADAAVIHSLYPILYK